MLFTFVPLEKGSARATEMASVWQADIHFKSVTGSSEFRTVNAIRRQGASYAIRRST